MLQPPTVGLPLSVPENGLFSARRWSLYPDRLMREQRDFLWGWTVDRQVRLDEVRIVYGYHRARPLNLIWAIFAVPPLLLAWWLGSERSAEWLTAGAATFGLGILAAACVAGFLRRPTVCIQTSRETIVIGMDSPFYAPDHRRRFFNGLAQILGIPDLLPGGGVPRPPVAAPAAPSFPAPQPPPAPVTPPAEAPPFATPVADAPAPPGPVEAPPAAAPQEPPPPPSGPAPLA